MSAPVVAEVAIFSVTASAPAAAFATVRETVIPAAALASGESRFVFYVFDRKIR